MAKKKKNLKTRSMWTSLFSILFSQKEYLHIILYGFCCSVPVIRLLDLFGFPKVIFGF